MADKKPSIDFSQSQNDVLLYVGTDVLFTADYINLWHNYLTHCAKMHL